MRLFEFFDILKTRYITNSYIRIFLKIYSIILILIELKTQFEDLFSIIYSI